MNEIEITPEMQKRANSIALKAGYGKATKVIVGDVDRVIDHTPYGYRKNTTGEYVAKAYLRNFGWKNTYYQPAETVVELASRRAEQEAEETDRRELELMAI